MRTIGKNALQLREPARACIIKAAKNGKHQFGGVREDLRITGVNLPKPIQHVLSLSTADPLCPIKSSRFSVLPLLYPMLYGNGGGEIQYTVLSNTNIRIHHLSSYDPIDDVLLDSEALPQARVALRPLSYGEERLLCAMESSFTNRRLSARDRARLRRCDDGKYWRAGGRFDTCQGSMWTLCRNPACDWRDAFGGETKTGVSLIAIVQPTVQQFGKIWGEYSEDVQFCFGYCPHCGAIIAENRCG